MGWTGALACARIAIAGGALALRFATGFNGVFLAAALGMVTFGGLSLPGLIPRIGYSERVLSAK